MTSRAADGPHLKNFGATVFISVLCVIMVVFWIKLSQRGLVTQLIQQHTPISLLPCLPRGIQAGEAWTDSTVNGLVAGREWCRGREIEREKGAGRNGKKLRPSERVSVYACVSARERAREETCEACALCRFLSQSQTASCGAGTVTTVLPFSVTLSVVLHWPRNPSPGEPDLLFPSSSRRNGHSKGVIEQ